MAPTDPDNRIQRSAVTAEDLQLQILAQMRDNMALMNQSLIEQGRVLQDVDKRLIRVEERDNRIEAVTELVKIIDGRVDALMQDKSERVGAGNVIIGMRGWVPVLLAAAAAIASIFSAVYLLGRAGGLIAPAPGTGPAPQHQASKP